MESNWDLVEQAIGYHFKDKKLLQEALTAAGAEGDGHDGNKHLASVGHAVLLLAIANHSHMKLTPRGLPYCSLMASIYLSQFRRDGRDAIFPQ